MLVCFVPPLLILAAFEVETRLRYRRARRLTLKRRGLAFGSGELFCPWKAFAGLRFYPIREQPNLKRCVVLRHGRKKQIGEWSSVSLALDAAQQQALTRAVPDFRPAGLGEFQIEERQNPAVPVHPSPLFFKAMTVYTLGFYLLLHGAPLLAIFYPVRKPDRSHHTSELVITERRAAQIADFIARHFESEREFQLWGFWTGTTLTVLGITGLAGSAALFRRSEIRPNGSGLSPGALGKPSSS